MKPQDMPDDNTNDASMMIRPDHHEMMMSQSGMPEGMLHSGRTMLHDVTKRIDNLKDFQVVGLNWQTADLTERELAARQAAEYPVAIPGEDGSLSREALLLSTCNRLEIYAVCAGKLTEDSLGTRYLSSADPAHLYHYRGIAALEHLFSVTSGLQSMILGESEIFAQVKKAYSVAVNASATGGTLNRIFHSAFTAAKQIRTVTDIGRGNTSYASASFNTCRDHFGTECQLNILLLGAGEIAATVADFFQSQPNMNLTVISRTESRAMALAEKYGCEGYPLTAWQKLLPAMDVVIGGLAIEEPFFNSENLAGHLQARDERTLLLIDLSIPRNFSPELASHPLVKLVNLDELQEIIDRSLERRQEAVCQAQPMIAGEIQKVKEWAMSGNAQAVMSRLSERVRTVALKCLVAHAPQALDVDMEELKLLHRSLMKLIMHTPVSCLRDIPGREHAEFFDRLGKIFCPETPLFHFTEPGEGFDSPALVQGVRFRILLFLQRVGLDCDIDSLSRILAEKFVTLFLAHASHVRATAVCSGQRRALEQDMKKLLPD